MEQQRGAVRAAAAAAIPDAPACTACRGRGWKFRRPRRVLVRGTVSRGPVDAVRVTCPDCDGSRRAH